MLKQIRCEQFAEEFRTIDFHPGLNTILGSVGGGNALGKSTFLWVIDFAFGGDGYCGQGSDIKANVHDHTIESTFVFDETPYYFRRSTATQKVVMQCDSAGHLIKNMSLDDFRKLLAEHYRPGVPFTDIQEHFFRIYGKENVYERIPYQAKLKEQADKAADFLLRLFGKGAVLIALQAAEEELGIKESQWTKLKPKTFEKIEENEATIASLRKRMEQVMAQDGNVGISILGLGAGSFETVNKLQKELRALNKRRNQLKSKLESVQNGNRDFINTPVADDFEELHEFFPDVNIQELSQIENFHKQIHAILQAEIDEEVAHLTPMITRCEREMERINDKLEKAGVAEDVTQRVLTECVNISKTIDKLENENRELARERELQAQRILAERKMEQLINDRVAATEKITAAINKKLAELNAHVTGGKESPPALEISRQKEITYHTAGNTSEGTAFKSLVLYDLAMLELTTLPALVHDGNLLHSISREHFGEILHLYQDAGKQIFIAVDKEENDILAETAVLELSEGHELFGFSWSKGAK